MVFVMVALFKDLRPPIVILLTIPFTLIGVIDGRMFTCVPFRFVTLLAPMSLAAMRVKNALALIDGSGAGLERGLTCYDATIAAVVSRLRPIVLATATAIPGVIPLLKDVFWFGLPGVTMAGLSFGAVLTMILMPTLCTTISGLKRNTGTDEPDQTTGVSGPSESAS